ncbi:peptide deformylase [Cellulomonas soli]|uniref:peptide deformylase n=1 Tax=Cellulomonas soli TaxID=931535 RepID=UPI003F8293E4
MSLPGEQHALALRDLVLRVLDRVDEHGVAPIVQVGHPALRAVATPVDGQLSSDELSRLLDVMHRTMRAAPGVGLAAPQLGLPLALAVVEDPGSPDSEASRVRERGPVPFRVLVNPRYEVVGEQRASFYEGCLSVIGYQAVVPRARQVRLKGHDEHGAAFDEVLTGWPARIVQHETDHLGGTLYLDRALLRSLAASDPQGARWLLEPSPTTAAQVLGFSLD